MPPPDLLDWEPKPPRHPSLDYKPPRVVRLVNFGMVAVLALVLMTGSYVGWWFFLSWQMRSAVENWTDERNADGWAVSFQNIKVGGFPFTLHLNADTPSIAAAKAPNGVRPWGWQGEKLMATLQPWSPRSVVVSLPGKHTLGMVTGQGPIKFEAVAQSMTLESDFAQPLPERVALSASKLELIRNGTTKWTSGDVSISLQRFDKGTDYRAPSLELAIQATDVTGVGRASQPLGNAVQKFETTVRLMGTIGGEDSHDENGNAPEGLADALAHWRDQGGTIEVATLNLGYGPLNVQSNGTLALDSNLQPMGSFSARVQGFFTIIEQLRKQGWIRARDAIAAKLVLGVLARKGKDGRRVLNLPLSIQEQTVFAGPVPLAKMPDVRW